jgi:hypothetical protein
MKAALVWRHEQPQRQRPSSSRPGAVDASPRASAASSSVIDGPCHCLCYSPDGYRLVAGVGARVLVFDADGAAATPSDAAAPSSSAPSCRHSLRGHGGPVLAVAHAGAAGRFASGDATGTVVVWTGAGQPVLRYSHGAGGLPLLIEQAAAAAAGATTTATTTTAPAPAAAEPILALAWSACPSQPRLASVSPTELALWDPGASREVVKVPLLASASLAAASSSLAAAQPPPRATRAAAWSPGGGRVLALGLSDGSISLRDGCAGGVELRRVSLSAGAGAAALAVVWLRAGSGGGGGLGGAALAVSTADGRLHEVVLPPGGDRQAALSVRSWRLGAGMTTTTTTSGGGGGTNATTAAWGNAVSVSLFCPGGGAEGPTSSSSHDETLLLLGGACGRVSLVAWRPSSPSSPSSSPVAAPSSCSSSPFFDLGPFWSPGDLGAEPSTGECPEWVWALAQRPGGCAYSAIPALAGVAAVAATAPPATATPAPPLPAHLPVAHVALGRHDGSVSVVAAHLPTVHALHLSGEHGHVYAAREGLTSVSVRRLRRVAAAAAGRQRGRRRRAAAATESKEGDAHAGIGILRFGELVQRVGVYGARVAVQLRGRVEVFERRRRGAGAESSTSSDDGGDGGIDSGDDDGAWSDDQEEEDLRAARRRFGWPAAGSGAAAAATTAGGARGAPSRGGSHGDAYALVAALVPVGAERLLGPLSSRAPGACSLLVVGARHVFLCTGARMAAYAVSAQQAATTAPSSSSSQQPQQQPQQDPEREWTFDSAIRYVRAAGGPPGAETLLVGLRSGAVAAVFADRPGPPLPLVAAAAPPSPSSPPPPPPPGVRCLDLSADRLRLAVVDDSGTCSVYEPFGPAMLRPEPAAVARRKGAKGAGAPAPAPSPSSSPLWRVRGAESCAWSDAHPDVLAVSGGGHLAVHFVPLVVGEEAGAAALASAAAQQAIGAAAAAGSPAAAAADESESESESADDPIAARRRTTGLLAAAALEEGRLLNPPLSPPPPSTQDAGGGLVVGLAGATAFVLLRPSAAAAVQRQVSSSSSTSVAAPALAALSVPLGAAVRHLARQRVALGSSSSSSTAAGAATTTAAAPGLAAARAVACLGASRGDWRQLADEALDALDLRAASDAFARLRDARGAELAARLGAAAASGACPTGALRAEVAAWAGRFARASRLFCRAGCPSQAVEMWLAMGKIGPAREIARRCGEGGGAATLSAAAAAGLAAAEAAEAQRQRQEHLLELRQRRRRRKGQEGDGDEDDDDEDDEDDDDDDGQQREEDQGAGARADPAAASAAAAAAAAEEARALVSRGDIEAAVGCMIEHGLWEQLRALAASLPEDGPAGVSASASSLLKRAAAAFASAGLHDDAAALLVRLGDTPSLISLHAAAGRWREAALLAAGGGPALARRAHLPRAAALAGRGRWAEAADADVAAGLPHLAARLLRSVAASAAEAGKYAEAAAWARMRADLVVPEGAGEAARAAGEASPELSAARQQQKFRKRLHAAEAYWAYAFVHDAAKQPFAVHPPALVFRAACFLAARGLGGGGAPRFPPPSSRASPGGARRLPHGVSLTEALITVVRLGPGLGEADAARRVGEFLLGLRAGVGAGAGGDADDRGASSPRIPPLVLTPDQLAEVEMAVVCARAAAPPCPPPPPSCCPRCGAPDDDAASPLFRGACGACGEPFHVSPLTFERLPLVEFRPDPTSGLSAEKALALVGRGGFRLSGGGGDGAAASASASAEPCGALEDQEALERAWALAVKSARPVSPLMLPASAIRRLRPREVVVRRRMGRRSASGGDGRRAADGDDDLQLFRLMDGGAVPLAVAASGHFCEQDELEAAVAAEQSAAAGVDLIKVGAGRPPSFLAGGGGGSGGGGGVGGR